jgi:hypothetical protein
MDGLNMLEYFYPVRPHFGRQGQKGEVNMENYGKIKAGEIGEGCKVYFFEMPDGTVKMALEHDFFMATRPKGYIEIDGLYPYMGTAKEAEATAYNLAADKMVEDGVLEFNNINGAYYWK